MGSQFLKACARRPVEFTPIWFMRQAGRYLPSYRKIRESKGILEIANDPKLASSITVDPVRQLGVDAAVVFADIMLPLQGMGVKLKIQEDLGPVIERPVRTLQDVEGMADFDPERDAGSVLETVRLASDLLGDTPLVGFSGAPFTLASYLIEGSPTREFLLTKQMMYRSPDAWDALMGKLTALVKSYLLAQAKSGAAAVQLFDSWVGCLSPLDYGRYVAPYTKEIFEALSGSVPRIHFCANSSALVEAFSDTGCDLISVDWRIPIDTVWERARREVGVQGNLDPAAALTGGNGMEDQVNAIMRGAEGRRGHVFNLGHGVLRDTPPENLRQLVKIVHTWKGKS